MNPIALIRELDRLFLVAKASDKASDWIAYFQARTKADTLLGIHRPAA